MIFETYEQRFRREVLASLQRIERALKIENTALANLIAMEKSQMTTLADILTKATALATAEGAAQATVQHERDAATAHAADLQKKLDDALAANATAAAANAAPAVDPAQLDAIAAQLDQAKAIADALAAPAA